MATIEVRVAGRGRARDGESIEDETTEARCELCGEQADAVVSTGASGGSPFACKTCLRQRLESVTIAIWQLGKPGNRGLPWGKISG